MTTSLLEISDFNNIIKISTLVITNSVKQRIIDRLADEKIVNIDEYQIFSIVLLLFNYKSSRYYITIY